MVTLSFVMAVCWLMGIANSFNVCTYAILSTCEGPQVTLSRKQVVIEFQDHPGYFGTTICTINMQELSDALLDFRPSLCLTQLSVDSFQSICYKRIACGAGVFNVLTTGMSKCSPEFSVLLYRPKRSMTIAVFSGTILSAPRPFKLPFKMNSSLHPSILKKCEVGLRTMLKFWKKRKPSSMLHDPDVDGKGISLTLSPNS